MFIVPEELIDLLPDGTSVTPLEAERFIAAAKARLGESHAPAQIPENGVTEDLVEQMAYARAIERHYLKGEGAIEVPAAKDAIQRAEAAFLAYDARFSTEDERDIEAPRAYITEVSW